MIYSKKAIKAGSLLVTVVISNYLVLHYCNLSLSMEHFLYPYRTVAEALLKILICIIIDILLVLLVIKSQSVMLLVQDLWRSKDLIWRLSKNDFKTKYAGSYLGITWAFVQPIVAIIIYWLVFEFGLRSSSPVEGIPFVLWLTSGLIAWFFFSDAINYATNSLIEYSYLVKKVVFKISVLPIVKIISALFIQTVFIFLTLVIFIIYEKTPTVYAFQLIYYVVCTAALSLACSYITASIVVFFRDLSQLISIFLQIGIWATPIMWNFGIVPENYQWIVKLNPLFYIVNGYRDSLINQIWFWQKHFQTAYFWIVTITLLLLGALVFKKLKIHFADVL